MTDTHVARLRTAGIRGLQGNLTLSYTYITAIALLLVELLGLLAFQHFAPTHVFQEEPSADTLLPYTVEAATYFQNGSPDIVGLQAWLDDISLPVFNLSDADDWLQASFGHFPDRERQTLLVATVADGVLAVTPANSPLAQVRDIATLPGRLDQSMFAEAPQAPGDGNVVTFRHDNASVVVMPITDDDKNLLALMILITDRSGEPPSTRSVLMVIGGSLILFTMLAAGIGTMFGYFTARRLTRRLDHLVDATSAWGKGNFTPRIDDTGPDEIGQLGTHLTQLAGQLQDLLARRENWAVSEARNHLARELHDSVKQQVFAIRMHLGSAQALAAISPEQAQPHLESAEALASQAQIELKRIIDVLRPQSPSAPVRDQLRDMLESWTSQSNITLDVQLPEVLALPAGQGHDLLRIASEALANVQKHSGANAANVVLKQRADGTFELAITDNGHGFDPGQVRTGFGLVSMRERVQAMGGTFSIHSSKQGTTIRVELPVEEQQETYGNSDLGLDRG